MSPLSQQSEEQAGDCSNIEDRQPRTHDRRSASSFSAHVDQSARVIAVAARTRRNELQCSNLANTLEQLRVVIERRVDSLYSMRNGTGSQWRTSRRRGVTWSYFLLLQMSLAAALSTDWSPSRRRAGEQAVAAVHPRSDKGGDSGFRSPKRQRLDAAPDETELAKATADCPRNMTPHGQVRLQQDAKIAHSGRGPYQGYTDTQLRGVKMHTPSTGRTPHEVRLLGVKTQSVRTHPFGDPFDT